MAEYPLKILVATDGSQASEHALRHATDLYPLIGSELHMVMVGLISQWTHPDTLSASQLERIRQETEERLANEADKLRQMGTEDVFTHVRLGKVDSEIVRLADDLGIGLIVIGNRGVGSLERLLLGNDAESVVRHASCGVLVVR